MEQLSGKPFVAAMNREPVTIGAVVVAVLHFKGLTLT
jgi:hypothetical protein